MAMAMATATAMVAVVAVVPSLMKRASSLLVAMPIRAPVVSVLLLVVPFVAVAVAPVVSVLLLVVPFIAVARVAAVARVLPVVAAVAVVPSLMKRASSLLVAMPIQALVLLVVP